MHFFTRINLSDKWQMGAITIGNVITANKATVSQYMTYMSGQSPQLFVPATDILRHEYGHMLQWRYQGSSFLVVYGASAVVGWSTGRNGMIWNVNEYYLPNHALSGETLNGSEFSIP
jgi:hypothetical protein